MLGCVCASTGSLVDGCLNAPRGSTAEQVNLRSGIHTRGKMNRFAQAPCIDVPHQASAGSPRQCLHSCQAMHAQTPGYITVRCWKKR